MTYLSRSTHRSDFFADDTVIYLTVDSQNDCKTLQQDLQKLEVWEKNWEIDFNPNKCQVLHISQSRNPIKHPYIFHDQVLQGVDHAKYLRLQISRDLIWNTHIQNVTVKANRTLGFIRRNIRTKHKDIRDTAYNTFVRPQVEYASPVWGPYTQANINKIEKVQRRAAR